MKEGSLLAPFFRFSRNSVMSGLEIMDKTDVKAAVGYSIRATDMPGAHDLRMWIYAATTRKERGLISERTKGAMGAARARRVRLGGDSGYRPSGGPDSSVAVVARRDGETAGGASVGWRSTCFGGRRLVTPGR
jgi:DNA invertase Pin-like site-specific DNA recombinase